MYRTNKKIEFKIVNKIPYKKKLESFNIKRFQFLIIILSY